MPLDRETVCDSVRKTSKVLLLHEDTRTGGMAGELAATITENVFEYLDGPIVRVTAPDTPVPFSPPLEEAFLPNAEKVAGESSLAASLLSWRRRPRESPATTGAGAADIGIGAGAGSGRWPRQSRGVHADRIPYHTGPGRFRGGATAGFVGSAAARTAFPLERDWRASRAARGSDYGDHRWRPIRLEPAEVVYGHRSISVKAGERCVGNVSPDGALSPSGCTDGAAVTRRHPRGVPNGGADARIAAAR